MKFVEGKSENIGDHMIVVQRITEIKDDVFVVKEKGKLIVKAVMQQMEVRTPSPAMEAAVLFFEGLSKVPEDQEEELLKVYSLFSKP